VYTNLRKLRDDLPAFAPDHFVCVPLVLHTLHTRVCQRLAAASRLRAAVAGALLAASLHYVRAARVAHGESLAHALPVGAARPSSATGEAEAAASTSGGAGAAAPAEAARWGERLRAALLVALLGPLHALAQRLVFGKVRARCGLLCSSGTRLIALRGPGASRPT
jgi:long-chain acyl-CoA synthetase